MTLEEKKNLYRRARAENPELAAVIDACHEQFPGCRVTYLKLGDEEWGQPIGGTNITPLPWIDPDKMKKKKGRR
jgi:hypothetical protein